VGIATVTTMLDRRAQFHQSRLMEHVNGSSAAYHNMLNGTQARLISAGIDSGARQRASARIDYGTIQRQAVMLAFIDNFQNARRGFLRGDSDFGADEEAEAPGAVPVH